MSVSQEARSRQQYLEYYQRHGNARDTGKRYHVSVKTLFKWKKRWDGTPQSLEDQSRAPHHVAKKISEKMQKLIKRLCKKYKWQDIILAYQEARDKHSFTYTYHCFEMWKRRFMEKKGNKKPKKRHNKPYERASYPGQKVQIDVKFVPTECLTGEAQQEKYYVYVAVDECTRWTYRQIYREHSTYSSTEFLREFLSKCPFMVRMVQTDNGSEFTKRLLSKDESLDSLFEEVLKENGILYHRIKPGTPRHNGKVERTNRIDQSRFYNKLRMYSFEDGKNQLKAYQDKYNDCIKHCLDMQSPNQIIEKYLGVM